MKIAFEGNSIKHEEEFFAVQNETLAQKKGISSPSRGEK
jgi:hypothetical protein